jgi:hypothetical protein
VGGGGDGRLTDSERLGLPAATTLPPDMLRDRDHQKEAIERQVNPHSDPREREIEREREREREGAVGSPREVVRGPCLQDTPLSLFQLGQAEQTWDAA